MNRIYKNHLITLIFSISLFLLIFVFCENLDTKDQKKTNNTSTGISTGTGTGTGVSTGTGTGVSTGIGTGTATGAGAGIDFLTKISGTWLSECKTNTDYYYRDEFTFYPDGTYMYTLVGYYLAGCSMNIFNLVLTGDIILGPDVSGLADTKEVDVTMNTLSCVVTNSLAQVEFNNTSKFGINDWQLYAPRDIFGKDLGGYTFTANSIIYDIAKPDGANLYLSTPCAGNNGYCLAVEDRPTTLDEGSPLVKQ